MKPIEHEDEPRFASEAAEQPQRKTSSMMHEPKFNPETNILTIQFTNGVTYDYPDFPEEKFKEFHAAPSWGKYFSQNKQLFENSVKQVPENDEIARAS